MRSYKILAFIVFLFFTFNKVHAQTNSSSSAAPSDAVAGYTYDFDAAKKIVIEHQIQPNETNAIAKPIIKQKSFPKIGNSKIADAVYHESLKAWMEKNPTIIIEALKSRKDIVIPFIK